MFDNDRSLLLAKKAKKFSLWQPKGGSNEKEQGFMSKLLEWSSTLNFDGRLVFDNENFKQAAREYFLAKDRQEVIGSSPGFIDKLNDEELKELVPNLLRHTNYRLLKRYLVQEGRLLKEMDLDDFYSAIVDMENMIIGAGVSIDQKGQLSRSYRQSRQVKGMTAEQVLSQAFFRRFLDSFKKLELKVQKQRTRYQAKGDSLAFRSRLEKLRLPKVFGLPSRNLEELYDTTTAYTGFLKERAMVEVLLYQRQAPEITELLSRGFPQQERVTWIKAFLPRLKDKNLLLATLDCCSALPEETLIWERLIELDFIGDGFVEGQVYGIQHAWYKLKEELNPDRYSDNRLRKDKKLLKRIWECGHSPYVISLFERGLIKKLPRTMTPKLAIYFARKGLITSFNEIPGLRLKDYPEVEFPLIKEAIFLDDLRPIHLSNCEGWFGPIADYICQEGFDLLAKNESIRKRFYRSMAMLYLQNWSEDKSQTCILMRKIQHSLPKGKSLEVARVIAEHNALWSDSPESFYEMLEKALNGEVDDESFDGQVRINLCEENVDRAVEVVLESFERSKKGPFDELKKASLLLGLAKNRKEIKKMSEKKSPKPLSLDQLLTDSPFLPESSAPEARYFAYSELKSWEDFKDPDLDWLCSRFKSMAIKSEEYFYFLSFLEKRGLKLFGKDIRELVSDLGAEKYAMSIGASKERLVNQNYRIITESVSDNPFRLSLLSLLDISEEYPYQTRAQLALVHPERKFLAKDKSQNVQNLLLKTASLDCNLLLKKLLETGGSSSNSDFVANFIRTANWQQLQEGKELFDEEWGFFLDLELYLRREERQRALISKLKVRKVYLPKTRIKTDSISKFIKRNWVSPGLGRS